MIIGLLAAIAIPQYNSSKEPSYDATAKSDLRNLVSKQEMHLIEFEQYATDVQASGQPNATTVIFDPSAEMTIGPNIDIISGGGSGSRVQYTAQAKHPKSSNCWEISVGPDQSHRIELASSCSLGGGG